jgi:hypothetical protein
MPLDKGKLVGFTVEGTIVFDESYGAFHDVLANFLGFDQPALRVSCGLGGLTDWHAPLEISSFRLAGTFTDAKPKPPCESLQLRSVGASVTGYNASVLDDEGRVKKSTSYMYGLFGTMHMMVPGSRIPLEMDFEAELSDGQLMLAASLEGAWNHAFGISCLTVSEVIHIDFNPQINL